MKYLIILSLLFGFIPNYGQSDQPFIDHFDDTVLNARFTSAEMQAAKWYKLKKSMLGLELLPAFIPDMSAMALITEKQSSSSATVSARLLFYTLKENEKAGLIVYQNENNYYFICRSAMNGIPVVQLFKGPGDQDVSNGPQLLNSIPLRKPNVAVHFKINLDEKGYSFYYSIKKPDWLLLRSSMSPRFQIPDTDPGKETPRFGMFASAQGMPSINTARFDWYEKK